MIKRTVPLLLDILHAVALAVWLGGLVVIAGVVMPTLFPASGLVAEMAEKLAGTILRRFLPLVEICGLVMLGAQFLVRRRYQKSQNLFVGDGVRQLLTFGALLLAEMCLRDLLPQMDRARLDGKLALFQSLHTLYSAFATAQMVVLGLVVALTVWLHAPGGGSGSGSVSRSSSTSTSSASAVVRQPTKTAKRR